MYIDITALLVFALILSVLVGGVTFLVTAQIYSYKAMQLEAQLQAEHEVSEKLHYNKYACENCELYKHRDYLKQYLI